MPSAHTTLTPELARAAAAHTMAYPFKGWGFGEDIALRALLELEAELHEPALMDFVSDQLRRSWRVNPNETPLAATDHVAPGVVMLELHARLGDDRFLEQALALGRLLTSFPVVDGVAVHRRDLDGWRNTVWVDCMALDGPFLARLAVATGDPIWADHAAEALLGYARVLQNEVTGLFVHGYDVGLRSASSVAWGRGNGWALHGLIDTLEVLPADHPARREAQSRLEHQLEGLRQSQHPSGRWTTVLDDPTAPIEESTAAFFAAGALKAQRLGLLPEARTEAMAAMNERALSALVEDAGGRASTDFGTLQVSNATPIGDHTNYINRPLGVFPWGQGPLILSCLEVWRGNARRSA